MGSLYRRKNSPYWWYQISRNGKLLRKSTKCRRIRNAQKVLEAAQVSQVVSDILPTQSGYENTTYENLRTLLVTDYKINLRKSRDILEFRLKHLDDFFKGYKASEIGQKIDEYIQKRIKDRAKNGTINRELSALRRMFTLARQRKMAMDMPHISKLKENNVRTGFLKHHEYLEILKRLPDHVAPIVSLAYMSGMRKSEILNLTWDKVDFRDRIIWLDNTKSDEPRFYPMDAETLIYLGKLSKEQTEKNVNLPWVFLNRRKNGRVKDFRHVWRKACKAVAKAESKPELADLLFHDLRRCAVRNMVRAGVPRKVAMQISGHKTETVFERYNIVSDEDLKDAVRKHSKYLGAQYQEFLDSLWDTSKM